MDLVANVVVGVERPHYSFVRQYVSDLAARGGAHAVAQCVLWAAFPLLFGPFAFAVAAGLRGHPSAQLVPFLLMLFSVFIGLCGVFRYDPVSPEATFPSRVHVIVSPLAGAALLPCPFFVWLATRRDRSWRAFRRFCLFAQVVGIAAALLYVPLYFRLIAWRGLAERSFWGVYYVWIAFFALRLRRTAATESPGRP